MNPIEHPQWCDQQNCGITRPGGAHVGHPHEIRVRGRRVAGASYRQEPGKAAVVLVTTGQAGAALPPDVALDFAEIVTRLAEDLPLLS